MGEYLLKTCIFSLKAFLCYMREHRKRVLFEDEDFILETCVDMLIRIQTRTVGPFGVN